MRSSGTERVDLCLIKHIRSATFGGARVRETLLLLKTGEQMNKTKAKEILGDKSQDELREIITQLNAKEFLFLESDIELKKAVTLLLKTGDSIQ